MKLLLKSSRISVFPFSKRKPVRNFHSFAQLRRLLSITHFLSLPHLKFSRISYEMRKFYQRFFADVCGYANGFLFHTSALFFPLHTHNTLQNDLVCLSSKAIKLFSYIYVSLTYTSFQESLVVVVCAHSSVG